ncbi:MAG TPA: serine/threonine dehydratase [Pseudonocardiaceae bacterium]|jgi:threonine dehydratase|nr:serine/threonine dehydratase [Pseudonocardiaceae bacterium]
MTNLVLPTETDVRAAARRIAPYVRRTPVLRAEVDGRELVLKLEHLQRTGSFKLRGAVNALLAGPPPKRVVTVSGGNHGLAVATAAGLLGLPATVYAPANMPESKARRIVEAGADVVRFAHIAEAFAEAERVAADDPDTRYLHPFAAPEVIAGQGTVTEEIVADVPEVDSIVVAVGGGGLAAGAVLAAGGRRVVAVEPEGCRCLHDALAAGAPVESAIDSVAASALGANRTNEVNFAILNTDSVSSVLVTDAELLAARDLLWTRLRLAVEPAAGVPLAAWLAGRVPGDLACLVLCGANTDWQPV